MSRLSLRLRLTLAFAAAMAVLLTATGTFLYVRLGATLDDQLEQSLRARADDVAALVGRGERRLADRREGLAEGEETFAQVLGAGGEVRDATPPLDREALLAPAELARARRGTVLLRQTAPAGLDGGPVRLLATPVEADGEAVVVVAGASLDDRDDALAALRTELLVGGPAALLLASLAGYALAAAALRPVEAMRRRAAEISATTAARRLPVPPTADEVGRLARTLNEMLARLEAGLERERRFVADASHELRTPLSSLRTELELALRRPRPPDELRAALASAADETERLVRLADDLLVLARADEGRLPLRVEPLDARALLHAVAARFAARATAVGRRLEVDVPAGTTLTADELRVAQALGNLVDNALRHGAGTVCLEAAPAGDGVEICVRDRGPGFPAAYLPRAFERFSRADGARGAPGAGLGLALVDAIVRAHGGIAVARNRGGGGAEVVLALPARHDVAHRRLISTP